MMKEIKNEFFYLNETIHCLEKSLIEVTNIYAAQKTNINSIMNNLNKLLSDPSSEIMKESFIFDDVQKRLKSIKQCSVHKYCDSKCFTKEDKKSINISPENSSNIMNIPNQTKINSNKEDKNQFCGDESEATITDNYEQKSGCTYSCKIEMPLKFI